MGRISANKIFLLLIFTTALLVACSDFFVIPKPVYSYFELKDLTDSAEVLVKLPLNKDGTIWRPIRLEISIEPQVIKENDLFYIQVYAAKTNKLVGNKRLLCDGKIPCWFYVADYYNLEDARVVLYVYKEPIKYIKLKARFL
jgi:hypothetical protein